MEDKERRDDDTKRSAPTKIFKRPPRIKTPPHYLSMVYPVNHFDNALREAYNQRLTESAGFDCAYVVPGLNVPGLLSRIHLEHIHPKTKEILIEMAKLAVQHFNNGNVKSYTFLKLSKVNSRVVPHLGERGLDRALYYMTFEATEDMVGSPQNFQALVLSSEVDGKEVRFCRIETSNPPDLDLEDIPPLVMLTML